jgi:Lytic transglycolase
MRKAQTHVIGPPTEWARWKAWPLWLAGLALLLHLGIAVSTGLGHTAPVLALGSPLRSPLGSPAVALGDILRGQATWYGAELHGNPTASGEPFDMYGLTAAHRTLPLGSRARVTNLTNGKDVIVRINDRGPGRAGVMIDLSYGAAQAIGMQGSGPVEVAPLE